MHEELEQKMLTFTQEYHVHQTRHGGKSPYWHHCFYVGKTLSQVFEITKEGSEIERQAIILAGIGHDLYEDTTITKDLVIATFGEKVHEYMMGMTNEMGDEMRTAYVEKMSQADEPTRIIKMADLLENYSSGVFCVYSEGVIWIEEFLIPILDEMWECIQSTHFTTYKESYEYLKPLIENARLKLHSTLRFK